MKYLRFVAFGSGLLFTAFSLQAQEIRAAANIPFDFVVQGRTLPADHYTVQAIGSGGGETDLFRNDDGSVVLMVLMQSCRSKEAAEKSKLVFHRLGDNYFLSEIWIAGRETGRRLPTSREEIQLAMNQKSQEVVIYAALTPR